MKRNNLIIILLSVIAVVSCVFALTGCSLFESNDNNDDNTTNNNESNATQTTDTFEFTANSVKAVNTSISGDIVIPSEFNGYTITEIPSGAFSGCSGITSITIPDTVTSTGSAAFKGCISLKSMTLPFVGKTRNATEEAGVFGYIFGDEEYLSSTKITQYYQSNYPGANVKYYIPDGLKSVTITNAAQLSVGAFSNMSMLENINLNDDIIAVGWRVFYGCSNIKTVNLPSIAKIPESLFDGCSSLKDFVINENVTTIEDLAFSNCIQLNRLNSSEDGSFIIPDTVKTIGEAVFCGCVCIQDLTLPFVGKTQNATEEAGVFGYIFGDDEYLSSTKITQYYKSNYPGANVKYYIPDGLKSVTITNAIQISVGAFSNMTMLTSLRINSQAQNAVGWRAFYNCVEPTWY